MNAETIDDRILRFIKQELSKEGAYSCHTTEAPMFLLSFPREGGRVE
jgi:hypothetical protein